jgi:hypothetical protein
MSSYIAPHLRKAKNEPVTLTDMDFPSFGSGSVTPNTMNGFKQTILNLIARDQLEASERNRKPQQDHLMMTYTELYANGWAVLSLADSRGICSRFNDSVASDTWASPVPATSVASPLASPVATVATPNPVTQPVELDDSEYESDYSSCPSDTE